MNLFNWIHNRMPSRYRAKWLYRRGMVRAKLHDHQAALADYTAVIDMAGVPTDIRAMAIFNRALVFHATGSDSDAIDDLNRVLEMGDAVGRVKTEARRTLIRMEWVSNRADTDESVGASRA
jgi:hypothetical protein